MFKLLFVFSIDLLNNNNDSNNNNNNNKNNNNKSNNKAHLKFTMKKTMNKLTEKAFPDPTRVFICKIGRVTWVSDYSKLSSILFRKNYK